MPGSQPLTFTPEPTGERALRPSSSFRQPAVIGATNRGDAPPLGQAGRDDRQAGWYRASTAPVPDCGMGVFICIHRKDAKDAKVSKITKKSKDRIPLLFRKPKESKYAEEAR